MPNPRGWGDGGLHCLVHYLIPALKPKLANHKGFAELSKKFVMVNTEDNDEPKDEQFDVDGKYVPRIFFLGENFKTLTEIPIGRSYRGMVAEKVNMN